MADSGRGGRNELEERILILAPSGRDAVLAVDALERADLRCQVCRDAAQLSLAIAEGAGVVVVAGEALPRNRPAAIDSWIGPEPEWSHLPLVVLTGRDVSPQNVAVLRQLELRANVTFLQRPVPKITLVTTVRAALDDRRRQYVVRGMLAERERVAQAARDGEARLRLALDGGDMGTWDWDLRTGRVDWDARQHEICGYEPGDPRVPKGDRFHELVHPDDRDGIERAMNGMLEEGKDLDHEFRIVRPDGQTRWLAGRGQALRDDIDRPIRVTGINYDVTERKQTEMALRESEARFRSMADGLPLLVWVCDADGMQRFANRTLREYFAVSMDLIGDGQWQMPLHPDDGDEYMNEFLACLAERRPFHAEVRVRRFDGAWRWLESWARARFADDGAFLGFVGASADVTDRKRVEEQQQLLVAELQHRVKNVLSTVQAIMMQSMRTAPSLETFKEGFVGRLLALARGHDVVLRSRWRSSALSDILHNALGPYGAGGRISVACEEIWLRPQAALAVNMIVHELATNAAKYGALSAAEGTVDIDCRHNGDAMKVVLSWTERGGPPVRPPAKQGFGSRVIERSAKHDLDGEALISYRPEGVRCVIHLSIDEQREHGERAS